MQKYNPIIFLFKKLSSYIRFIINLLLSRPYTVFFFTIYGCLLLKYYTNSKIYSLHNTRQQIKKMEEEYTSLEIEYTHNIYKYLQDQNETNNL
jgi:hypothetical protein